MGEEAVTDATDEQIEAAVKTTLGIYYRKFRGWGEGRHAKMFISDLKSEGYVIVPTSSVETPAIRSTPEPRETEDELSVDSRTT